MNEELQQALADLVNKSVEIGGDAIAFTQEQLPEVIQQLLIWKAAESLILCAACVGWIVFTCFASYKVHKVTNDSDVTPFIVMVAVAVCLPAFFNLNLIWLQIWLAPKVYLIEYAASLAK